MTFALWEQILLVVLVAGTAFVFVRDLMPKIRHIRAGKPDRVRTDQFGRRVWTVFREVVFQTKVIRGRPVAGTMHALVFLAFMLFGLETTDHFLEPYGGHFLRLLFGSGGVAVFQDILAVVAILGMVGISALAYRRFVMVKISPDPKSYSSGIVAAMIFLLMATYLYGIWGGAGQRLNWWVHALLIVAFPPLILRSKHFHLLLAPVDIFFRTHTVGELLPLNLDMEALESEDDISLGLETMADVPWKMRMDFLSCVECRRCTDLCPAANCSQDLDPRGFVLAGRNALDLGAESAVIGSVITEKALGQCTSCGACETICPVGIEHLQVLVGAKRAQALASGTGMVATTFLATIERYGNPFSEQKSVRKELLEALEIPIYVPGETEYLLWLGCVWTYNLDARSALESLVQVLKAGGVSFGVLEEESCSGHHSRRQGEEMQFQTLATENIERFNGGSVKKMIAPCPHCLHSFRKDYPGFDDKFEVEVLHHSEVLAELIRDGKISLDPKKANGKTLTYHDPCYLGRYEGEFQAPRDIIGRTGSVLTELPRTKERSFCCGGGNAGFTIESEEEQRVDQERKREIQESGADVLITGCPECKMMLDATVAETKDLAELVAEAMVIASDG